MTHDEFEKEVAAAVDALPAFFRLRLNNVIFVVEDWPDRATMEAAGIHNRSHLLGFYHGIPLTERTNNYSLVLPDQISIYRQPILHHTRSEEETRALIRHTVEHEIAHYFGIDDDRLHELGAY